MAQNDIYKVTMIQSVNGSRVANVLHYRQDSVSGGNDPKQDLADGLEATLNPLMVTALSSGWKTLCYEVAQVGLPGQAFFKVDSAGTPGGVAIESFNAATCAVLATFTATGSHQGTGRLFLAGIPVSYEHQNNLLRDALDVIGPIGDQLILPIVQGGVTFTPGRYSATSTPVFDPWILEDVRIPLTKLRGRRQSTKC